MTTNLEFEPADWLDLADDHGCHPMAWMTDDGDVAVMMLHPSPPAPRDLFENLDSNHDAIVDFLVSVGRVVEGGHLDKTEAM